MDKFGTQSVITMGRKILMPTKHGKLLPHNDDKCRTRAELATNWKFSNVIDSLEARHHFYWPKILKLAIKGMNVHQRLHSFVRSFIGNVLNEHCSKPTPSKCNNLITYRVNSYCLALNLVLLRCLKIPAYKLLALCFDFHCSAFWAHQTYNIFCTIYYSVYISCIPSSIHWNLHLHFI